MTAPRSIAEMFADPNACQFFAGDPRDNPTFCPEPRLRLPVPGGARKLPYCEHHACRCYQSRRAAVSAPDNGGSEA